MKHKVLVALVAVVALACALSPMSKAEAVSKSWDYSASLSGSQPAKGSVDVERSLLTHGNGQATVKGLAKGHYNVVLDVQAHDFSSNQTNSSTVALCSIDVSNKNASSSCENSSVDLPYGDGLFGTAKVIDASGATVEQGSFVDNSSHTPKLFSAQTDSKTFIDLYGEHLSSTDRAYFQKNGSTQKVNASFQVKNNNWVHVFAPTGLTYNQPYNVTVVTAHGSATFNGAFTPSPPAPVVKSVSPSPLDVAGGQTITVKGPNVGYLNGTTPTPIHVDDIRVSSYKIISDSEIQFTSPAHSAGNATLELIGSGGTATYPIQYA